MSKTYKYPDNGKVKFCYDNGNIELEGQRKDGEHIGIWTWWYENGVKKEEGYYIDGKKDGKWTEWWDDGKTKLEKT